MITKETWIKGWKTGISTTWNLGKIIFPITLVITILNGTPVIDWVVRLFEPVMRLFGLPGDAAFVLVLGNLLNLYAGIGAMLTMDLTVKQVFILSIMLSFSHNLLVETAVTSRIGVNGPVMAATRLGLAVLSGLVVNLLWSGGQELARYGFLPQQPDVPDGWMELLVLGAKTAVLGVVQLALIVIPLMIGIQILKDVQAISYLANAMAPLTRLLGVSEKSGVTLMAGIVFGIAYGAGVMIQAAKEDNLSRKDLYLTSIFLITCHAVIEDTLLFVPLGINVLYLLLIRIVGALVITMVTAKIWSRTEMRELRA